MPRKLLVDWLTIDCDSTNYEMTASQRDRTVSYCLNNTVYREPLASLRQCTTNCGLNNQHCQSLVSATSSDHQPEPDLTIPEPMTRLSAVPAEALMYSVPRQLGCPSQELMVVSTPPGTNRPCIFQHYPLRLSTKRLSRHVFLSPVSPADLYHAQCGHEVSS